MFEIKSSINLNQSWTQIQSFITSNEQVLIVMFKRNVLGCVQVSLQDFSWKYDENSLQITDNNINSVHYVRNQTLVLDTKGAIFHFNFGNNGNFGLEKVGQIPCEMILGSCLLDSKASLICLSCDKSEKMTIKSYNCESKAFKSCAFVKPNNMGSSEYILRCLHTEDSELILIGCADGSIVECSTDCSHTEILHQCEDAVVEIFRKDEILYFVQSDGCLLEYKDHRVSMKYLPQSVPKHCVFMSPSLVYSDGKSTFLYDLNESNIQELSVRGVINISHKNGHLFLLTIQGMLYSLQDTSSDEFLSKLNQFESLNSQLDLVDSELSALSIYTRAQQLKCRFMTRLCITEGELDKTYKFKLDLTHNCEGVTFDNTAWSCLCSVANHNVVLPFGDSLQAGSIVQMSFVLSGFELSSHVSLKIYLVSGPNSELRVPVADSVLTLFALCSPTTVSANLSYSESLCLKLEECRDILHRVLMTTRHTFTREAWDKVGIEKTVLLKYGTDQIELCVDEKNRELLVKSTSEEVCNSVVRIIQAGFISAGFLYSDYLKLNSIKVDAEIEEFQNDTVDLAAMKKRLNDLKSI